MGTFSCEINTGACYARHSIPRLLNLADAGSASHAFNSEIDAPCRDIITRLANGIDHRRQIRFALESHVGAFRCKIDGNLVDARNFGHGFFNG
ncbi:hypothetical protein D3C87_1971060 [compost metagenome]